MMSDRIESRLSDLFSLFEEYGLEPYIGENVSQLQHAQQAAQLARQEGHREEVVAGAFLHDIGHLIGARRGLSQMRQADGALLGVQQHEIIGENYLKELGFGPEVTNFVRGHVLAKKFLVSRDPNYFSQLSEASQGTLKCQGGPMTEQEAIAFENRPDFEALIRMRHWDDQAKDESIAVESLDDMRELCRRLLTRK